MERIDRNDTMQSIYSISMSLLNAILNMCLRTENILTEKAKVFTTKILNYKFAVKIRLN